MAPQIALVEQRLGITPTSGAQRVTQGRKTETGGAEGAGGDPAAATEDLDREVSAMVDRAFGKPKAGRN